MKVRWTENKSNLGVMYQIERGVRNDCGKYRLRKRCGKITLAGPAARVFDLNNSIFLSIHNLEFDA